MAISNQGRIKCCLLNVASTRVIKNHGDFGIIVRWNHPSKPTPGITLTYLITYLKASKMPYIFRYKLAINGIKKLVKMSTIFIIKWNIPSSGPHFFKSNTLLVFREP